MSNLRRKSCPRCQGTILVDRDYLGWYEQCLQCGYQYDLRVPHAAGRKLSGNHRDGTTLEVTG